MLPIIFTLFSFISIACDYTKLSKYSSVTLPPDRRVYLDISSFEIGELITFEIKMDLFFGDSYCKSSYEFYIGQVPANIYYDSYYWNNLPKVTTTSVTCSSSSVCIFTWEEIKKSGNNYIYILTPAPFDNFYSFWEKEIKISNTGGLSAGEIAGIVIGSIVFVGGIITLILACYCCKHHLSCGEFCPCCACCTCCGNSVIIGMKYPINQPPVIGSYPAPAPQIVFNQPVYPQPVYPPVY